MNEVKEISGMLSMHQWEIEPVPKLPHQQKTQHEHTDNKRMKLEHDPSYAQPSHSHRSKYEMMPGYRPPETSTKSSTTSSYYSSAHSPSSSSYMHGTNADGRSKGWEAEQGIYGPSSGADLNYSSSTSPKARDGKKGKKSKKGLGSIDSFLSLEDNRVNAKRANRFKNDTQYTNQRPPTPPPVYVKVEGTILTDEDLMKMKITGDVYLNFKVILASCIF